MGEEIEDICVVCSEVSASILFLTYNFTPIRVTATGTVKYNDNLSATRLFENQISMITPIKETTKNNSLKITQRIKSLDKRDFKAPDSPLNLLLNTPSIPLEVSSSVATPDLFEKLGQSQLITRKRHPDQANKN